MKKLLALLTAAVATLTSAWAAAPVAVWEGDFDTTTKNGITFDKNGNDVATDGSTVTIDKDSDGGVKFSFGSAINAGYVTVLVKYSNYTAPEANAVLISAATGGPNAGKDLVGAASLGTSGKLQNIWNDSLYGTATDNTLPSEGLLALTYAGQGANAQKGAVVYAKGSQDSDMVLKTSGLNSLYSTATAINNAAIGGQVHSSTLGKIPGMSISAVAIFNSVLSTTDMLGYVWPSEISAFTANNVSGTINWSDIVFDNEWSNGSDKAAVINLLGDTTITLPETLTANKITFNGEYTVKLVGASDCSVGQWIREGGAKIERIVSDTMIATGFTVETSVDYVINKTIEPTTEMGTVTVPAGTSLIIRGCTTKPKFAQTSMKGTLVIENGATMVSNISDLIDFYGAAEVHVYGTLDTALTRWTLYPSNKLYVYGGSNVISTIPTEGGTIDGGASLNTINANSGIICRKGPNGENTAAISAVVGPQLYPDNGSMIASTIEVEEGMTVTLSSTIASSADSRKKGFVKTGDGTLKITGDISTLKAIRCDAGTLEIAEGASIPMIDVASTGAITVDSSIPVVLVATDAQLKAGFSTTIAGGESVTCVDTTGAEWELTKTENTYTIDPVVYTFNGSETDKNWSTASNWSTGKLPRDGAAIVLTTDVTVDQNMTLPELTANEGVKVVVADTATLTVSRTSNLPKFAGTGTIKYTPSIALNAAYASPLTFDEGWAGILHLSGDITMVYGNFNKFVGASKIKLSNCHGYLEDNKEFYGEIILENANANTAALNINNGDGGAHYYIDKISGSGTIKVTGGGTATQQTIIGNADGFNGAIEINGDISSNIMNRKSVLFGTVANKSIKEANNGSIIVASGATVTIPNGKRWTVDSERSIKVEGTLKSTNRDQVKSIMNTPAEGQEAVETNNIEVRAGGVLELVSASNQNDATDISYNNITGTGSIKLSGNGYHVLPNNLDYLWASSLSVIDDLANGMILSKAGTADEPALYTIGTFSGTGNIRVDYVDAKDSRSLRVVQSANKEWSGTISPCTTNGNRDRFNTLFVAGAEGAAEKTLTISGKSFDSQCPNVLHVESTGSVNLTGNWVGTVEVEGVLTKHLTAADQTFSAKVLDGGVANVTGADIEGYTFGSTTTDGVTTWSYSPIAATDVSLDKTEATLEIDGTVSLTATVTPADTLDKTITWTSDNEEVATVDGGVVTAVAVGTATITATCGEVSATCTITVSAPTPTRPTDIEGGSQAQKDAFDAWVSKQIGLTDPSTANINAFILDMPNESTEEALEAKLASLITSEMVQKLAAGGTTTETTVTIPGYGCATFKFVPVTLGEGVTTSAKLFKLTATFVPTAE